MSTPEKCEAILREILRRCNEAAPSSHDWTIGFGRDWGGNSMAIFDSTLGHTHVGGEFGTSSFEVLVNELHDQLVTGRGLTWA